MKISLWFIVVYFKTNRPLSGEDWKECVYEVSKQKNRSQTGLVLGPILAAFVALIYMNFRLYLEATGKEMVNNFLATNSLEIQRGNLIGALSKNQRFFVFLSIYQGNQTLWPPERGQVIISLGEDFDFESPTELPEGEIVLKKAGFLHSQIFYLSQRIKAWYWCLIVKVGFFGQNLLPLYGRFCCAAGCILFSG